MLSTDEKGRIDIPIQVSSICSGAHMHIPKLRKVGMCTVCNKEVDIPEGCFNLPSSHQFNGNGCQGSNCSADNVRLVIGTREEAMAVARFLRDENGYGSISRALAEYCLQLIAAK